MQDSTKYIDYVEKKRAEHSRQVPLTLGVLGMIFSAFFGIGAIFSIIGIVLSFTIKKDRTSKKWALAVGISGLVLSVLFIAAICVFGNGAFFVKNIVIG